MKHVIKKPSETQVTLTVTLDAADLAPIQKKTISRLAKTVKVSGFRAGKVPADVAAKHIDPTHLAQEALEDAVNSSALDIIDEQKIMPLDRPKIDVTKYVPAETLEYTAEIQVIPEIKLGDYKKLKATKPKADVTEKDITEVLERLQTSMATKQDVTRAAKKGDEVIMDFTGQDQDGKEVAGASGADYPLALGSGTFIPGFEDGLIGKKAGDVFDLPLTFPKDYHHKPLAGAKVTFKVTVKAVKEVAKPELNDEFAAKAGPFKTIAELKADITRELTEQKQREATDKLKDDLVGELVKSSHVPVPQVLVDDQIASIERDFVQNLMYRGMTLDQYLEQQKLTKEEWRKKELLPQAERRVQVGLVLSELSKVEKIEVTKAELDERLADMLKRYGNSKEIVAQLDTPESRRDITNRALTEKTVDRLVEIATK
ncbi:MAG TPA: trigger factor [Candidatus Saccharimonadales bacterium]|nr:trigger factor [Candidatus Saccharimonadales bacterium]